MLYIPIWLYSNLTHARLQSLINELYIPIWLYSNSSLQHFAHSSLNFTFQSGYIQIVTKPTQQKELNLLYIPIWLYSNLRCQAYTAIYLLSLHSNLVIFKSFKPATSIRAVYFTFQSGYIQIQTFIRHHTFCFFFTFQSGYIQMYIINLSGFVLDGFTFQSGYIQINARKRINQGQRNFTFQSGYIQMPLFLSLKGTKQYLYIPIWLYSNYIAYSRYFYRLSLYIPIWLYSNKIM